MPSDEWKKLNRELKILQAKKSAGGYLHPKDKARLEWLQERLGEAEEVKRIAIEESDYEGPKKTTSDDHWATEVSEELMDKAGKQKLTAQYEKEQIGRQKRKFEARDYRETGGPTFKQEGLSQFAVEATDDLKSGEVGLAQAPGEEVEAARKRDHHRAVHVKDESERLTKKAEGSANPFALDISDGLATGLDDYKTYEDSAVPDSGAKSFEVDVGDDTVLDEGSTEALPYEEVSEDVQSLMRKSYELPKGESDESHGAKTTHLVEDSGDDDVDADLLSQAVEFAEKKGLVDEEQAWAVDEDGNEATYTQETEDLNSAMQTSQPLPQPAAKPKRRVRWSDEADTQPAAKAAEGITDTAETKEYSQLQEAIEAERRVSQQPKEPEPQIEVPDLTDDEDDDGILIPEPPDLEDDGPQVLIPEPPQHETQEAETGGESQVLIPEPPAETADPGHDSLREPASVDEVPDLSDGEELELAIDIEPERPPARENQPPKPAEQPQKSAENIAADDFWGLSDDRPAIPEPPQPAAGTEEATAAESPRSRPAPKPEAAKKGSRPLPALSFSPDQVVPAKEPPKQKRVRSLVPDDSGPRGGADSGSFLNDLFDDSSGAAGGPDSGASEAAPLIEPGAPPGTSPFGPPKAKKSAGKPNDLSGPRRATVHFKDGVNRRGTVSNVDTDTDLIRLEPLPGSNTPAEDIVAMAVKAIFLLLPRGTSYPEKEGNETKIVMIDGRKLEGYTPDYDPRRKAFTLFPKQDRGNIERVIVFNEAIKNIWFEDQ